MFYPSGFNEILWLPERSHGSKRKWAVFGFTFGFFFQNLSNPLVCFESPSLFDIFISIIARNNHYYLFLHAFVLPLISVQKKSKP